MPAPDRKRIGALLKELRLPGMRGAYDECVRAAEKEGMGCTAFLLALLEREAEARRAHRVERLVRESRLPLEKSFGTFDLKRLPPRALAAAQAVRSGVFATRHENVLLFGSPGSGKTHLMCALAHEQARAGRRVLYTTCALLVQHLLAAKRDLTLAKALKKYGGYDVLLIDDIGYVQYNRDEMEVLFTLLADRYERGSVMLTSNLPFSQWEQIFKDPVVTAAAIDRLVHHSIIIELNLPSYRMQEARKKVHNNPSSGSPDE